MAKVSVLIVGLEPTIIDFSDPAFEAFPGVSAKTVQKGLDHDQVVLREAGYDAEFCLTDYGETAGAVLRDSLAAKPRGCVVIGAGVRLFPKNTPLLEMYVDTIRVHAPDAKICFNTNPADTADAVRRWFPTSG